MFFNNNNQKIRDLFLLSVLICAFLFESAEVTAQKNKEISFIITGSFKSRENATNFSETLHHKDLDTQIGYNPKGDLYYVYTFASSNENDIIRELQKVKSTPGLQDAWVYTGELTNTETPIYQSSKPGYVVAGSYKNKINAALLAETLGMKGLDCQIIYDPAVKRYYVHTLASSRVSELKRELQRVKKMPALQNAWIVNEPIRNAPNSAPSNHPSKEFGYVVTGSYSKRVNAEILSETLAIAGLDTKITYNPEAKLFYVYTLATSNESALARELKKIRSVPKLQDSWIFYGETRTIPTKKSENKSINNSKLSYVMAGRFKRRDDAVHYADALRNKGLNASILYDGEQDLYYVSLYKSTNTTDAARKLQDYANTTGLLDTWVYTGRLTEDIDRKNTSVREKPESETLKATNIQQPPADKAVFETPNKAPNNIEQENVPEKNYISSEGNDNTATAPRITTDQTTDQTSNKSNRIVDPAEKTSKSADIKKTAEVIKEEPDPINSPATTFGAPLQQRNEPNHTATEVNDIIRKTEVLVDKLKKVVHKAGETQKINEVQPTETNTSSSQAAKATSNSPQTVEPDNAVADINNLVRKTEEVVKKLKEVILNANQAMKASEPSDMAREAPAINKTPQKINEPAHTGTGVNNTGVNNEVSKLLAEMVSKIDQLVNQVDQVITAANDTRRQPNETNEVPEVNEAAEIAKPGKEAFINDFSELLAQLAEIINEVDQIITKAAAIQNESGETFEETEETDIPEETEEETEEEVKDKKERSTSSWNSGPARRSSRNDRNVLLSVGLGAAVYFGDLKDKGNYLGAKPLFGVGLKTFIRPRVSTRIELNWFRLSGDDGISLINGKSSRNLSFRSDNIELTLTGMMQLLPIGSKFYRRPLINPYVSTGIGLLYFNPMGKIPATSWQDNPLPGAGSYIPLQPLNTENVKYRRLSIVIPVGIGFTCKINPYMNLGLEAAYRITNTDYLDDVSTTYRDHESFNDPLAQAMADKRHVIGLSPLGLEENHIRGNPTNNDGYLSVSLKFEYYLPPRRRR